MSTIIQTEPLTGHPERVTRPFWQSRPCPPWCATIHQDHDYYADRHHHATAGEPIDLSLYDDDRTSDGNRPGELDFAITQHYRSAEATVTLLLPLHELDDSQVTGELDLELTVDEARALRDRLSVILGLVDGGVEL